MSASTQLRSSSPATTPQLTENQPYLRQYNLSPSLAEDLTFLMAQPKNADHKWGNLRIEVPGSDNRESSPVLQSPASAFSPYRLDPPIEISPLESYDMGSITQLPTPVLKSGLFTPSKINVPKRQHVHGSASGGSHRAVSEFLPGTFVRRAETLHSTISTARHVSNPSQLNDSPPVMPLPPLDPENAQLVGQTVEAPHLGRLYVFDEVVGKGTFSTVARAHSTTSLDDVVAVKIVEVPTNAKEDVPNFRLYICRELGILTHLNHPCIVGLLDYSISLSITLAEVDQVVSGVPSSAPPGAEMYDFYNVKVQNKQYFFLQYCKGGNLFRWLYDHYQKRSRTPVFWELMRRVVAELIVCVAFLHSHDVVHRDLKLENVLLNFEDSDIADTFTLSDRTSPLCILTDFGLSKKLNLPNQLLSTKCGSQDYVSPELLMGVEYDGKLLDSWSLGVLIYAILEDRLPFDVPPIEFMSSSSISPSVLKRRRKKHNPAHRIAMIDWEWLRTSAAMKDDTFPESSKTIMKQLISVVEVFLIRKDRRMSVTQVLHDERFQWIKEQVPAAFLEYTG